LLLGLPTSILSAWLFAEIFEMPFKRNRSWKSMLGHRNTDQSRSAILSRR